MLTLMIGQKGSMMQVDHSSLGNGLLIKKFKKLVGDRTADAITRKVNNFVANRTEFTIFGNAMGYGSTMVAKDNNYIWEKMVKHYGDNEEAYSEIKKVLGTIMMMSMASDSKKWMGLVDDDKRGKKERGEIPDANKYWVLTR